MKKVCLIITYFGKWPAWINFFMRSCQLNPSITWIVFTDCGIPECTSDNVNLIDMTLSDFNELASEKLCLNINMTRPYKLCDLKPAFPTIFEDYLKPYDFVGYGDVDLIYGNIRAFLTDELLGKYDIITTREEAMAGHFSLFTNSEKAQKLYELSPRYKKIFQDSSRHYAFDELYVPYGFGRIQAKIGHMIKQWWPSSHEDVGPDGPDVFTGPSKRLNDMTHIIKKQMEDGTLSVYHETLHTSRRWYKRRNIKGWKVRWDSGKLFDVTQQKEIMYYHFLLSTKTKVFHIPAFSPDISRFVITRDGIFLDD